MNKGTDGPDSQTDSRRFVAQGLGADPALAQAKERQRNRFGEFERNPAVFKKAEGWLPANQYPIWRAFTFIDEKDRVQSQRLIESISSIRFAPIEVLMSTLFLPIRAADTFYYVIGDDSGQMRVRSNVMTLREKPEVTDVYHINGLIPLLQSELSKKQSRDLWFRATRPRPTRTKSYSTIFLPTVHVDDLVSELLCTNPVFKDWCRVTDS